MGWALLAMIVAVIATAVAVVAEPRRTPAPVPVRHRRTPPQPSAE